MEVIKDKQTYKGKLADFSFDEQGILHAVSKDGNRSIDTLKADIELVRTLVGKRKVCMVLDNSFTKAYDIEMIQYTIHEYPKIFKAVAFVPHSPIGKMISSILATLNPGHSMPIEMFSDKEEAYEWIMQYQ